MEEILGKSREWWALIKDMDVGRVDRSPGKPNKHVVQFQVKHGYTSKFAGEEIFRRVAWYHAQQLEAPKS